LVTTIPFYSRFFPAGTPKAVATPSNRNDKLSVLCHMF
jgi:hypothetical protein